MDRVYGGCDEKEKPARKLECNPKCGQYANCLEGSCVCHADFRGKFKACVLRGCVPLALEVI